MDLSSDRKAVRERKDLAIATPLGLDGRGWVWNERRSG